MSPYLFLALAAVVLFIFLIVVVVGLMAVHSHYRHKTYVAGRHYDLIDRELDRNPDARLAELNIGHVDGDLPWGRDDGFPSSEPQPKSLPVAAEPDG